MGQRYARYAWRLHLSTILSTGKVYLNSHSEIALLENIKAELLEYDCSMGWNSSTSIDNNNDSSNENDR